MAKFRITYTDPVTHSQVTEVQEFEDWTGRPEVEGRLFGSEMTITALEFAIDYVYTKSDKGEYCISEITKDIRK